MLQKGSETENKAQDEAPNSSIDTWVKGVDYPDSPKRPDVSDEESSDSDGDEQEAAQEQPRPLRWTVRVSVPPTRYG